MSFNHLAQLTRCLALSSRTVVSRRAAAAASFHTQPAALGAAKQEAGTSAEGFVPSYAELKKMKKEEPGGAWMFSLSDAAVLEFSRPYKAGPDMKYVLHTLPGLLIMVLPA